MAEPFMALVIYPTTADAQTRQADNLVRLFGEHVRSLSGFRGRPSLPFRGRKTLVTLTEWGDRDSFHRFRESEFGRAATEILAEFHQKSYWLRQHAAVEGP